QILAAARSTNLNAKLRCGARRGPSRSHQQVVLHQIGEAVGPGLVRVAANVHAVDERHFPGRDVRHVDIDVENEVRHFLDHDPGCDIGAELFAVSEFAAAAGPDLRTGGDLRLNVGGNREELIPAGSLELSLEEGPDQGEASLLRRLCRLEILMVVEELDIEEG